MRQGHRVYKETDPVWHKLKHFVNDLLQQETLHKLSFQENVRILTPRHTLVPRTTPA